MRVEINVLTGEVTEHPDDPVVVPAATEEIVTPVEAPANPSE